MTERKMIGFKTLRHSIILLLLFLLFPLSLTGAFAADTNDDYLYTSGSVIYDDAGNSVRLTGIAWFGFETQNQVYHGLWSAKMEDVLDSVADLGFNVLRIPLCVQLVNQWRNGNGGEPNSVNYSANPALEGMTSLEILDASIAYCKQIGLKVMLDMHRVVNTQMLNTWYTDDYPASDFEACWQWLAQHYANDDTVIAMDLFNEPHGSPGESDIAKWDDSTDQNNWKYQAEKVANLILDVNPELLIVVEGIEATPKDGYTYDETDSANYDYNWWGGNLRRAKDYPIDLGSRQGQLVYSPHDYGPSVYAQPWFYSGFTKATLTADCWDPNWLYIATQGIDPILVGEWGGKMDGGDNETWMRALADTIDQYNLNHTFWCVNPNSGDTGGILLDDWQSVDSAKYNLIEPTLWQDANGKFIGLDHQVNLGANGTRVGAGTMPDDVPVTGVTLSPTSASLVVGASTTLIAIVIPSNATNQGVTWASSDSSVATASSGGVVTAAAAGSATITVTTQDGGYSATCAVTVTASGDDDDTQTPCDSPVAATLPLVIDGEGEYCRVTSGSITNINSWNMQLVEINGVDYTNTWSNQMPDRIDGNYYIHYVGEYAWSHLEVNGSGGDSQNVPVTGVTLSPASTSVSVGAATTLSATVSPDNATDKSVTWSSSDTGVATVSSAGVVTGVSAGSAAITVTTTDGGFTAVSNVTVSEATTNYTLAISVSGNGSTSPSVGSHTYAEGASVSVTATPSSGATFTGWSGAATGTTNPITVTMDADKTLTAGFSGGDDDELPDECPGQCNAATPVHPTILSDGGLGNVTMYSTASSSGGACNYGATDVMSYAAINVNILPGDAQGQWQAGKICGQCAEVTALTSQGPQTVVVRIMDKCPDEHCGIDLGGDAPAAVMLDGSGRYDGEWRFVSCDGYAEVSDGSPALYVLPGSNPWWSRVHVRNGSTATDAITWQDAAGTANGYLPFATNPENAFEVPVDEVLQSGMSAVLITVHYVDGTTATVTLSPAELATESTSYPLDDSDTDPDNDSDSDSDTDPDNDSDNDSDTDPAPVDHVDNPFAGADGYINPDYAAKVLAEAQSTGGTLGDAMAEVADYSTAVWMDRIAAIEGSADAMSLRAHLDEALQQQNGDTPLTIMVVIYDLPNRDCAAAASNGELLIAEDGMNLYKTQYIDPIVEILSDSKYSSLRIVAVVEPDSLPNLVTNLDVAACAEANSSGAYVDGIGYAVDQLHAIENVYIYLDIAHSGWLGWDSNFSPAVQLYTRMLQETADGVNSIDGFITNTANYTPVEEVYLPDANLSVGGQPVKSSDFFEWNPYFDETDFATALRTAFVNAGLPDTIGMLIDTSRSGWGGSQRPDGVSGSSDLNTYVDQSRVDRRPHRGGWCNQQGAGIGARPQAAPVSGIDAYVWVKPPGESDGVSSAGVVDPDDPNKKFDVMCDPDAQSTYNASYPTNAMPDAPHAGRWFAEQFRMLVQNAYPPLVSDSQFASMSNKRLDRVVDKTLVRQFSMPLSNLIVQPGQDLARKQQFSANMAMPAMAEF
ncbi:MAG: glycoside hydrolase family 6 protein [Desulfobacteraceae bacterium]